MRQADSFDRDAFLRLGRSVRYSIFALQTFITALLDGAAWRRFGKAVLKRAIMIAVVGVAFAGITWTYSAEIFQWLLIPAHGKLTPFEGGLPIFTAPAEMFGITVSLAFRGGAMAATPVFIVSVYTLVSRWLPSAWRRFIIFFGLSIFVAFAGGVAFVYYVILPRSLEFLLGFGEGVATPFISVVSYYDLAMSLMFWMGVVFELPLVMYLLARLGLVSYRQLKWVRLAAWFFAPIIAMIITPSFDLYTWALVMIPLVVVYEFGLFLAWTARPDQGNYLWLGTIGSAIGWVLHKIKVTMTSPWTLARWAYRTIMRRRT